MNVTKTLYLHDDGFGGHVVFTFDVTRDKAFQRYTLLTTQDVTFTIPDGVDLDAIQRQSLERQIDVIQAEYGKAIDEIESRKARLIEEGL